MEQTMQAIGFQRYGGVEVLEPLTLPVPTPGPSELLIKVAAAGVNPADWRLRSGQFRFAMRLKLPFVPGSDIAGVVEAAGAQVSRFRSGDPVYAMTPAAQGGGYAEYAIVSAEQVAHAPTGISFAQAAGTPLVALTALQALRDKAQLRAGQQLLVYGASGGVGSFAVQIAKAMGAFVTAATSGRNRELVASLGADEVLDYTRDTIAGARDRYDVIFDAVNALSFGTMRPALRAGGVMVSVNPFIEKLSPGWLARFRGGRRLRSLFVQPRGTDLAQLAQWIGAGQVRPLLDQTYPLAEAAAAHSYSASGRVRGKLVLVVHAPLADSLIGAAQAAIAEPEAAATAAR
jgi:NADPH:quinone reductase-like Zn-dependent oxidoreductase